MENIGRLLKLVSEPIVRRQMVGFRKLGWSEKVQQYIDMHIHESITISKLADLTGRSESFISHHFRKDFGKTPRQYILARKMEIARNLLKGGDQVKQVAKKLGFYDEFHFSKAFKKYFHKSPRDLKKA
jgi:AraC-like DNA-binding protein